MLTRWTQLDDFFPVLNDFQRQLDFLFDSADAAPQRARLRPHGGWPLRYRSLEEKWPRAQLFDENDKLTVMAEVPGLSEKDIQVTLNQNTLSISGERKTEAPEGYAVHRQERGSVKFSRCFSLPAKVDLEKVSAVVKNGLLLVTLTKAPESQPRQITVKAS